MKKHFLIFTAVMASVFLASCKQDNKKSEGELVEFKPVSGTEVTVGAEGGTVHLEYQITNPTTNGVVSAEMDSEIDWISDINVNTYGSVSLNVAENKDTVLTRSTVITLLYEGIAIDYTVKQSNAAPVGPFAIEIGPSSTGQISWSVIPPDETVTYVSMAADKATWDSFSSYEEYMQYDIEYFKEQAIERNLGYEEFLAKYVLKQGTKRDLTTKGLSPETEYVVYAYAMDGTGIILSGMYYAMTSTTAVEQTDVTFELTVEQDFPFVTISAVPSDNEVYYLIDLYNGTSTPEGITEAYQEMLDELLYLANAFGQSTYDYMMSVSYQGPASAEIQMGENMTFTAFAVAVDVNTGKLTSVASTKEFDIEF